MPSKREVEGEGAIKTQRQVAVEKEIEAVIKGPAEPPKAAVPRKKESAYEKAVAAEDLPTAEKIVKETAAKSGYTLGPFFHGRSGIEDKTGADPTVFEPSDEGFSGPGIYLTQSEDIAKKYAAGHAKNYAEQNLPVHKFYVKSEKPFGAGTLSEEDARIINEVMRTEFFASVDVATPGMSHKKLFNKLGEMVEENLQRIIEPAGYDAVYVPGGTLGDEMELVVYKPEQIKSAEAVEKLPSGEIIPLENRFNPASKSVTGADLPLPAPPPVPKEEPPPKTEAKPAEPKPTPVENRLRIYQTIKEKLGGLIARHAAEIQKLEFKAGLTIGTSEGLTAAEIATQEIDKAKLGEIDKAKLLSALGELDALLKYLPAEVRGRVGGFYQLAKGTMGEKTLTEFFSKRIRMVERAFEQVLVKEYRGALDKLLASTKPKKAENRVRKSTLGPDVQDEADLARRASAMTAEQVSATLDRIEAALQKEGLTDEARADLMEEWAIVNGFGDLAHRNAEDLAAAHEWLSAVVKEGRSQWRAKEEARREKTRGRVEEVLTGLPAATEPGLAKLEKKDLASIARQTCPFAFQLPAIS